MNSPHVIARPVSAASAPITTPGRGRRTALVVTGLLACLLPTVFTINISRMLLTGIETDHRFHQLTGQGLVLFALWLTPVIAMLRAGWRGRRPSTAWGWMHVTFVTTGAVCAVAAPGGGAPVLVAVIAVTGALVWSALPRRPRLTAGVQIHPALAPVAMLCTAFYVPYAVDQVRLQNAAVTGYHSQNPHLFDMAWLVVALMVLALISALLPAGRHLALWTAGGSTVIGLAGLLLGEGTAWSAGALGLAVLAVLAWYLPRGGAMQSATR